MEVTSNTIIKLLIRRGLNIDRQRVVLASGEPAFTTDTERVFVGNGTVGGVLVGNKGLISNTGTTAFENPEPGDAVYVTYDEQGRYTNILYMRDKKTNQWINVHPTLGAPFDYASGTLLFNQQYLNLDTNLKLFTVKDNITTDTLSANWGVLYNLPEQDVHGTNRLYVDTRISAATANSHSYTRLYTWLNYVPLTGRTLMTGTLSSTTNVSIPTPPRHINDLTNKLYVDNLVRKTSDDDRAFTYATYLPLSGERQLTGFIDTSISSTVPAITINQYGTGLALRIGDTNNQNEEDPWQGTPLVVDNFGSLGIGHMPKPGSDTKLTVNGKVSATDNISTSNNLYTVGNIGVGTTVPGQKLDVVGLIKTTPPAVGFQASGIRFGSSNTGSTGQFILSADGSYLDYASNLRIRTAGTTASERIRIDTAGRVGINTRTPVHLLDVASTTPSAQIRATDGTVSHFVGAASGTFAAHGTSSSHPLCLITNGVEAMRITATGGVGIGTTTVNTPNKLEVTGATRINGNLAVYGDVNASGDITAFFTSDQRLKTNITPINNALDKIDQITGVTYDWDTELQQRHEGHDVGVLAQEVESILPEAVVTREDGYKAVNYEKLVPLLIQAIKELKTIIVK
jgi:hypothetical protein